MSAAADMWSVGMTVAETLTRQRTLPATLPEPFHTIAGNCLKEKPGERWTPDEILRHLGAPVPTPVVTLPPLTLTRKASAAEHRRYLLWVALLLMVGLAAAFRVAVVQNAIERREQTNRRRGG